MRLAGIDEAGYGPLLGPLAIVAVAAEAADPATLRRHFGHAKTGAKDSKQVHTPGDIAAIEAVALPAITWLTGTQPAHALACFGLLGEDAQAYAGVPWLLAAADLALPVAATRVKTWRIREVQPVGLHGALVQPRAYNATLRAGVNKADLELAAVVRLLAAVAPAQGPGEVVVDRLGGRRYYHGPLQSLWPDAMVLIEAEQERLSTYCAVGATREVRVHFAVDGESRSPLTAVASCIAKYVRELHMLLLNRYWCARLPALRPTAGYSKDARRWLAEVGDEAIDPLREWLIRAGPAEDEGDPSPATTAPDEPEPPATASAAPAT